MKERAWDAVLRGGPHDARLIELADKTQRLIVGDFDGEYLWTHETDEGRAVFVWSDATVDTEKVGDQSGFVLRP